MEEMSQSDGEDRLLKTFKQKKRAAKAALFRII